MSVEDRIRSTVDASLAELRERIERDARAIADQLIAVAAEEREASWAEARKTALDEAAVQTQREVLEAEERVRGTIDAVVADARATEREQAALEVRRMVEIEAEQKLGEALATADHHMKLALAEAEAKADQAAKDAIVAAQVREREYEMAGVTRLLDSIRGLDGAATLSEVLDALGLAAGREAARAAVLVLRNDRLIGWKLSGFGSRDAQPKGIDVALNECGVIGLAVGAARAVTTRDGETASEGPGFAHLPADRMGFAVPVIVGGRVVAVVYADGVSEDGRERTVPSGWPEVIEILARHAARVLEALTVQKTAAPPTPRFWVAPSGKPGTPASTAPATTSTEGQPDNPDRPIELRSDVPEQSARRFARLLLSEIKLYHEPAVNEGRRSRNLLSRLAPEIDRARRLYDARVPVTLRTRAELFQQELIATLAGGDAALLGASA
jgi:hypothetical protein